MVENRNNQINRLYDYISEKMGFETPIKQRRLQESISSYVTYMQEFFIEYSREYNNEIQRRA